jgi:hypothetical protein
MKNIKLLFALLISSYLTSCILGNNKSQKIEDLRINAINSTSTERLKIFQGFELGSTYNEFNLKLDSLVSAKTVWYFKDTHSFKQRYWRRFNLDSNIESYVSYMLDNDIYSLRESYKSAYINLLKSYEEEFIRTYKSPSDLPYDNSKYLSTIEYVENNDTIIQKENVFFEPHFTLKDSVLYKFEMVIDVTYFNTQIYILDLYGKKYGEPIENSWFIKQFEINYKIDEIDKNNKFLIISYIDLKINEQDDKYRKEIYNKNHINDYIN